MEFLIPCCCCCSYSLAHRVFRITLASHISPAGSARRYYYAPFSADPTPLPSPPLSFCSSYPFGLGRKAGPACSETLRLCSRALAIKRRPITIVIVVVIIVVISKRASERANGENFTGFFRSQHRPRESIGATIALDACFFFFFFHFLHSDKNEAAVWRLIVAI